jgi:hypothetical protein
MPDVFVADTLASSGVTIQVTPIRRVKVTVPGLPTSILERAAEYQPLIELVRYTRRHSRDNQSSGNGTKTAAYVHPAHGLGASGNGSFTHGGIHGGADAAVQAIRPTEWPIASIYDALDVTQGLLGFMCIGTGRYRDNTGNLSNVDLLYPSDMAQQRSRVGGRRFPYTQSFTPGYYAFRLSVRDLSDPRGKRIHGPLSQTIVATTQQFPFNPAGVDSGGRAQADVSGNYNPRVVNFYFATRIP